MSCSVEHHLCLSVSGYLHAPDAELRSLFRRPDGQPLKPREAREVLMDHLRQGHEVIPIGPPCEGFDWSGGGCPGHGVGEVAR